jgi:ketosteroid isomerase-like protein
MKKTGTEVNKKLVESYYAAWNTLNTDNPARFYAKDASMVFFDVAWMTLTFHLSLAMKNGAAMELDCRHTAIWEKRRGKWLIVHEHVSTPIQVS